MIDHRRIAQNIEPIIRKAGEILLSYFRHTFKTDRKADGSIVTTADKESERFLIDELSKLIPDVSFFAEESGKNGENDYCFVIDPLDGTTNFAHGIPYFCISVCLTYKHEPQVAAIYQPFTDEYFCAIKGVGARSTEGSLAVSEVSLGKALTVVSLPYVKNEDYLRLLEVVRRVAPKSFAFRCFGASALDLAYLAAGRIHGLYLADLAWWDVAAGMLLITEAGGTITTFEGTPLDPGFKTCVAGGTQVYATLKKLISDVQ